MCMKFDVNCNNCVHKEVCKYYPDDSLGDIAETIKENCALKCEHFEVDDSKKSAE